MGYFENWSRDLSNPKQESHNQMPNDDVGVEKNCNNCFFCFKFPFEFVWAVLSPSFYLYTRAHTHTSCCLTKIDWRWIASNSVSVLSIWGFPFSIKLQCNKSILSVFYFIVRIHYCQYFNWIWSASFHTLEMVIQTNWLFAWSKM